MKLTMAERIGDLIKGSGKTAGECAAAMGISASSLSDYANTEKERIPKADVLKKMASYFNVSSDYLLGLTKDRRRIPAAADALGLSEKAVAAIEEEAAPENGGRFTSALSALLENGLFWEALLEVSDAERMFNESQKASGFLTAERLNKLRQILQGSGFTIASQGKYYRTKLQNAQRLFYNAADEYVEKSGGVPDGQHIRTSK